MGRQRSAGHWLLFVDAKMLPITLYLEQTPTILACDRLICAWHLSFGYPALQSPYTISCRENTTQRISETCAGKLAIEQLCCCPVGNLLGEARVRSEAANCLGPGNQAALSMVPELTTGSSAAW